jgi:hypothetical protein
MPYAGVEARWNEGLGDWKDTESAGRKPVQKVGHAIST